MKSWLALFLAFLVSQGVHAQADDWDELLRELAEESAVAATDADEGTTLEALEAEMDELSLLHEQPLDINSASFDDLRRLPFLTDEQARDIVDHRSRYGVLRSVGELRLVRSLGRRELRWLALCTVADSPPHEEGAQQSRRVRHDFLTRLDIPLYSSAGWSRSRGLANRLRYSVEQGSRWMAGLRAEKDAGEPMFNSQNRLWDSWGAYAQLRGRRAVDNVILGDFKASMGEGLVLNNGFQLGKQFTSLWRRPAVLRPHRSTDETNFLRGVAATFRLGSPVSLTLLYSFRKLDATVQADNSVRTISTSGLHRTASELEHRSTLGCSTAAAHLAWNGSALRLGATAMYQHYDHQFRHGTSLYRRIYPEGYQFGAAAVDYQLRLGHLYVSGETARSFAARATDEAASGLTPGRGWATLCKAAWRFSPNSSLAAVGRFYSRNYYSALASAYGENSRVQNESGLTLLLDAGRVGPLDVRAMADIFYSPWPRYTMSRSSRGYELALQAGCPLARTRNIIVYYSQKSKERTDRRFRTHRLRATFVQDVGRSLSVRASAFATHVVALAPRECATGFALAPAATYKDAGGRMRCTLTGILFATGLGSPAAYSTATYDSRLFLTEANLYQSFSMLSLSGRGERVAAVVRYRASARWQLQAKCGLTHYRDRTAISSGPTLIRSPYRTDVQLLVRWLMK